MGSGPSARLLPQHLRPNLLHPPPRPRYRLLRAAQPLRPSSQLAALPRPRWQLRWRPRGQAIHGQLVRESRRQPSLHGTRGKDSASRGRARARPRRSHRPAATSTCERWVDGDGQKAARYQEQSAAETQSCGGDDGDFEAGAAGEFGGERV